MSSKADEGVVRRGNKTYPPPDNSKHVTEVPRNAKAKDENMISLILKRFSHEIAFDALDGWEKVLFFAFVFIVSFIFFYSIKLFFRKVVF
ncbi:hypothetical protein ADEAN_000479900 [Angomonas deanei]|uniref:Uncharacterized protein n=1 Tax=Angomonas deanei TaxID=59799 RepID=A0A7G2CED6_9TRYP|nr:hypothetical protein ADEAN_000479900 [Angomonas deanei]